MAACTTIDHDSPIGVFDSGVGGLTVLHELLVRHPREHVIYLGDTARFPYGEKTAADLRRYAVEITGELLARGVKLIVVACNSATAAALPSLREFVAQENRGVEVLGVVGNEARLAVQASPSGRIGLLATVATVESGAYTDAVQAAGGTDRLVTVPCPNLATLIQADDPFSAATLEAVQRACAPLREAAVDTVILGCTHYPLVAPMIQRSLGPEVRLVSSGEAMAASVLAALTTRSLVRPGDAGDGTYSFLSTGDPDAFRTLGTRFLQLPIDSVERVDIGHDRVLPAVSGGGQ